MKQNYQVITSFKTKHRVNRFYLPLVLLLGFSSVFNAQNTYSFTTANATGSLGPTQSLINSAYLGTTLDGSVVATAGVQSWTVPTSGAYRVSAYGAQGGGVDGGKGAIMVGDFTLTANDVLRIVVGQEGIAQAGEPNACGGGGGTYVMKGPGNAIANILVIAGGGGGSPASYSAGRHASAATSGNNGAGAANTDGAAGTNGNGGNKSKVTVPAITDRAAGGGGFLTDGQTIAQTPANAVGGSSFLNGSNGGSHNDVGAPGGFGGGGAVWTTGFRGGGGGGGYSGGGGGQTDANANTHSGGGGGSFNSGANQTSTVGVYAGPGKVIIEELCNISLTASGSNSLNPSICAGQSVSLTTNAVSNYAWSNGNTTNSVIVVSPVATTVYTLSATSVSNCTAYKSITVTVSSALPVLTITNTPNSICLGKTATLTAGGALSYTWAGGPGGVMNGQTFTPTATSGYTVTGQNGCGQSTASTTITIAPLAVSVASSSNNICAGNTAVLTATAAVNGFTWMPGSLTGSNVLVSPTVNTVYTLTASDGTCSGVATLSLDTKPIPTLAVVASATNVCEGAAVTLTVTGANTYTWSTPVSNASIITVNPASATSYVVVGTNGVNCTAAATQIVVTKPNPVVNVSTNKSLVCVDGAATLTASGGSTSYAWISGPATATNVVNPSVSSTYTVTGTGANGCTTDKTITVNVLTVSVSATSASTSICYGSSAVLNASGATTYTWVGFGNFANTTVSPTITTTYSVNANTTSQGLSCPSSNTITITVNALPTVSVSATKTVVCRKDANVVLTADGASTYVWGPAQTTNTISVHPQATITYSVTGTDASGCQGGATLQIVVNPCTGIEEITGSKTISVYPNPSNGEFTVICESDITLKVMNELGQLIQTIILNTQNDHKVSVKGLSNGVYFIVGQNQTETVNQKIIISQ